MDKYKQVTPESIIPEIRQINFESFEDFYNQIPYEGSLAILSLGAMGLLAWRKKRSEIDAKSAKVDKENNG